MSDKQIFVDTNILVYAYDRDAEGKHAVANELVARLWSQPLVPAISVQVLQEFYVNLTKKGIPLKEARDTVEYYFSWEVIQNTSSLLLATFSKQKRFKLSFWDSSGLAAARKADAKELWTEDFNIEQDYGGIVTVNPLV